VLRAQQQLHAVLLAAAAEVSLGLLLSLQWQHSHHHLSTTSSAQDRVQNLC
jgi:hypothetical protein